VDEVRDAAPDLRPQRLVVQFETTHRVPSSMDCSMKMNGGAR
jgi:hypothetical protein